MSGRGTNKTAPNGSRAGVPLSLAPEQQWLLTKQKLLIDDITYTKVKGLVTTWESKGGETIRKNLGTSHMLAELRKQAATATSVADNIAAAKSRLEKPKDVKGGTGGGKDTSGGSSPTVDVYDEEKVQLLTAAIAAMKVAGLDVSAQEVELAKQESLKDGGGANTADVGGGSERPKLEPPSKLADHPDELVYDCWIRELRLWRKAFKTISEPLLVVNLFKSLGPKTKRIVQSVIPEHQLTVDRIVKELDVQYAGSVEMRGRDELEEYRHYRRNGAGMQEFLTKWRTLRTTAIAAKQLAVGPGDYWDLLNAAQLPESQKLIVIGQLNERSRSEKERGRDADMLVEMQALLRNLSDLHHRGKHDGGGGRGKGSAAFVTEENVNARAKSKLCEDFGGGGDGDCWYCQTGNIHNKESQCMYSSSYSGKGRKGSGKGSGGKGGGHFAKKTIVKKKVYSKTTAKGAGRKGAGKGAKGARKGAQVKSEWDDQDWVCSKCQYKTFGSRRSGTCHKCGAARSK